jgi:hypothetical protein
LREAQQGLLAGEERRRLDEATRTQRDALNALGEAARRILAEAGRESETTLSRVMGTLQAAAVSPEGRELLARGRLTGDLEATGFELLEPSTGRRAHKGAAGRKQAARPRKARSDAQQKRLREARTGATAAAKRVRAAEQEVGKAHRDLARAEERLRTAEAAAAKAEKQLSEAERKAR